jgi:hypothetical protein
LHGKRIAGICSQMPNLTIMATSAAAAVVKTRLSESDQVLLARHASETSGDYCAGCERLCSEVLPESAPVHAKQEVAKALDAIAEVLISVPENAPNAERFSLPTDRIIPQSLFFR